MFRFGFYIRLHKFSLDFVTAVHPEQLPKLSIQKKDSS